MIQGKVSVRFKLQKKFLFFKIYEKKSKKEQQLKVKIKKPSLDKVLTNIYDLYNALTPLIIQPKMSY